VGGDAARGSGRSSGRSPDAFFSSCGAVFQHAKGTDPPPTSSPSRARGTRDRMGLPEPPPHVPRSGGAGSGLGRRSARRGAAMRAARTRSSVGEVRPEVRSGRKARRLPRSLRGEARPERRSGRAPYPRSGARGGLRREARPEQPCQPCGGGTTTQFRGWLPCSWAGGRCLPRRSGCRPACPARCVFYFPSPGLAAKRAQ